MSNWLKWPLESASAPHIADSDWHHAGSNLCLDFHGDPVTAKLVVFSDGNHHMALQASVEQFLQINPDAADVFYATTPPSVLIRLLQNGQLWLGNLCLSRSPHVFISPAPIMDKLVDAGFVPAHRAFMRSRGNVLLIRKGNPKQIQGIADLLRDDVRLFMSNPLTEKASYDVYRGSILDLAAAQQLNSEALAQRLELSSTHTTFGQCIHHREAPQSLQDGTADVAMVYYHLALRYTRIFPELFDFIPLGGTQSDPQPNAVNVCTDYHVGVVADGDEFGASFVEFLFEDIVTDIYAAHGLQRPV